MDKIYGFHAVKAVFLTRPQDITRVFIWEGPKNLLTKEYLQLVSTYSTKAEVLKLEYRDFLQQTGLIEGDSHQGICILVKPRVIFGENDLSLLSDFPLILVLDQVSNPRNLATILRSGAFFGLKALILLKDHGSDVTPEVTNMAVGGTEFVKIFKVANLARTLEKLKKVGFWIYGLDDQGDSVISATDFPAKTAFVIGAEGQGLRLRTKEFCDYLIKIPGGQAGIECLNAGVAASVALALFSELNTSKKII